MLPQTTTHFQHGFPDFVHHLAVVSKRLFRFGGELNVGARQMNKNRCWAFWYASAAGLVEPVLAPIHGFNGFRQQATALLIHQRHTVCEAKHLNGLVGRHPVAKNQTHLDLVGVSLRHGGGPCHRRDEPRINGF